ncbi:YceI family protein [Curtobacterium sp. 24E2]
MTLTATTIPGYQTGTWKIDPTHSEVTFSVRHLAISKVKGKFETFDATVVTAENPSSRPSRRTSTSHRSTPARSSATST